MLSPTLRNAHAKCSIITLTCSFVVLTTIGYSQGSLSACALLQPAELESALGGKAGKFSDNTLGTTHMCNGEVGKRTVMIRVAELQDKNSEGAAQKGVEMLRGQGWKIDAKKEGNTACSTAIPPAAQEQLGFNTTCSIRSNGKVLAVEVGCHSKGEMVSMDAVKALAQKALSRL